VYAPWIEDPDPPNYMTDDEIKRMAEGAAKFMRDRAKKNQE
jgi:hypothetical protein